jgi:tripartite-type tricarboxylate transporter receptor subunit TctC
MKLPPRRQFLQLAAGAAMLPAMSRLARAQTYPTRPVRWIVGFPPGGTADITARLIGHWLSGRLGQPFVIENRPGANTTLATEAVVRAPGDGYTLLYVTTSNMINATFTASSVTISFATSRWLLVSPARPLCWKCIRRFW